MKTIKTTIALILSLVMCLTMMTACGGGTTGDSEPTDSGTAGGEPTPTSGGTEDAVGGNIVAGDEAASGDANLAEHIDIIVNETQLTVVNPMSAAGTGGPSSWSFGLIYDRLVEETEPGVLKPMLAAEWSTDDYITFTFKLRDDVYFHNGDHFTAEDVVWTCELAKATPSSPTFARWNRVDTVTAIDDYTLEIVLKDMHVDFLTDISRLNYGILNRNSYDGNPEDPSWAFVGTGPFKVADFSSNDYLTVERFDDYWGDPPPTKSLTLWTIPEMSTRLVMLKNKEAQVSFQMTPEDLDVLNADPDYQVFPVLINESVVIGFNDQGDEIVTDLNFRLAIAHAIDCDEIATVALGNWAKAPWDGNIWGPDTQYRLEGLAKREYDLELAKEYLDKSPYNGETIEFITSSAHNIRAAEIIQLQLEAIGIKIDVQQTDHAGLVEALLYNPESKAQLHLFSLAMAQNLSSVFTAHTNQVNNRLNFADPFLYESAEKYAVTDDVEERQKIAHELQEHFYETVPAISAFYRVQAVTAVKGIGGMKLSSDQFIHNLRGIFWDLNETPDSLLP